jgi:hypothetical protein
MWTWPPRVPRINRYCGCVALDRSGRRGF